MATYQLRAMSIGEIIDGAFAIYRRHFATLIAVAVICLGVPTVFNIYAGDDVGVGAFLMLALYAVGNLVASGATIRVISDAYLGEAPSTGEALRFALGKALRIFVAGLAKYTIILLAVLALGVVAAIAIPVAVGSGGSAAPVVALVLLIAAAVPIVVLAAGYAVVIQAVVLEDLPAATDALGRSWSLTRAHRGRAVVLGVVTALLLAIPWLAMLVLVALVPGMLVVLEAAAAALQLFLYPIFASAFTLFYYDLRVRKEAFDLVHLSQQLGLGKEPVGA